MFDFLKNLIGQWDAWGMESPFLALMAGLLVLSGIFATIALSLLAVIEFLRKKFDA